MLSHLLTQKDEWGGYNGSQDLVKVILVHDKLQWTSGKLVKVNLFANRPLHPYILA